MSVAEGVFLNLTSIVIIGYVFVCSMCVVKLQKKGAPPAPVYGIYNFPNKCNAPVN